MQLKCSVAIIARMTKMLLLALALLWNPARGADVFLEKPYLQLGNAPKPAASESLMLLWHTSDEPSDWTVELRTSKDKNWRAMATPASQRIAVKTIDPHRVYRAELTGLVPGEEFRYRVLKSGEPVFESSGRARKTARQAQRFVLFGDCAQGTPAQEAVAYQASLAHPDFLFITGDIVYSNGRISEYRQKFFPIYNADRADAGTGAPLLRSVPFIAAPGNHDTQLKDFDKFPDSLAYFLYWDQPLNGPVASTDAPRTSHVLNGAPEVRSAFLDAAKSRYPTMANFSFDYGNAHWTVLDSNNYMDWTNPALREWVAKDLASAKNATWRFVAFHHPGFNSSKEHLTDQWMRVLSPVFEEGKVDVVFAGHVHNYQRTFPLAFAPKPEEDGHMVGPKGEVAGEWKLDHAFGNGEAAGPHGVIYIISGGGGAELYNPEQQDNPSSWQPFTQKYIAKQHSFSVVDIDGKHFSLRQLSDTGEEVDSFKLTK
jgi:3',5'-cyclic AMP phosphodiesterase CpdA